MRRFVRDRIAAALEPAKPSLQEYISRRLEYPLGFPYKFTPAAVVIREVRQLKVVLLAKTDLPPVQVEVLLKAWLANRAVRVRGDCDPGVLDANVQLLAHGTLHLDGSYTIEPQAAALKAWWRDMMMVESKQVGRLGEDR